MVAGVNFYFKSLPRLRPYPVRGHRLLYAGLHAVIALLSYQRRVWTVSSSIHSTTQIATKGCKQQTYNGPTMGLSFLPKE